MPTCATQVKNLRYTETRAICQGDLLIRGRLAGESSRVKAIYLKKRESANGRPTTPVANQPYRPKNRQTRSHIGLRPDPRPLLAFLVNAGDQDRTIHCILALGVSPQRKREGGIPGASGCGTCGPRTSLQAAKYVCVWGPRPLVYSPGYLVLLIFAALQRGESKRDHRLTAAADPAPPPYLPRCPKLRAPWGHSASLVSRSLKRTFAE